MDFAINCSSERNLITLWNCWLRVFFILYRLKRGSLKLFQSKNTLEKQCTRLNAKRRVCDKRSGHLRNDYLLLLSSSNAHQNRLFNTDLPYIMQVSFIKCNIYLSIYLYIYSHGWIWMKLGHNDPWWGHFGCVPKF